MNDVAKQPWDKQWFALYDAPSVPQNSTENLAKTGQKVAPKNPPKIPTSSPLGRFLPLHRLADHFGFLPLHRLADSYLFTASMVLQNFQIFFLLFV